MSLPLHGLQITNDQCKNGLGILDRDRSQDLTWLCRHGKGALCSYGRFHTHLGAVFKTVNGNKNIKTTIFRSLLNLCLKHLYLSYTSIMSLNNFYRVCIFTKCSFSAIWEQISVWLEPKLSSRCFKHYRNSVSIWRSKGTEGWRQKERQRKWIGCQLPFLCETSPALQSLLQSTK